MSITLDSALVRRLCLVLVIAYPVLIHIYSVTLLSSLRNLAIVVFALFVTAMAALSRLLVLRVILLLLVTIAVVISVIDSGQWVLKFNPVLINSSLAALFAYTLTPDQTPLITRIARLLGDRIDEQTRRYTRIVTIVWAILFVLLALESAILAIWAPLSTWSLMTGFVNYLIIGSLFPVEFLARKKFLPNQTQRGFVHFIASLRRADYRQLFID